MTATELRPKVYLDVVIGDNRAGRIVFSLWSDLAPKLAENFRALCTGEKGIGTSGKPLWYKGSSFHLVGKGKWCAGGDFTSGDGRGGESIYGSKFEKERFTVGHTRPLLLSMAYNTKDPRHGSIFFITLGSGLSTCDSFGVVFGEVIEGENIVRQIEDCGRLGQYVRPKDPVIIADCGVLPPDNFADTQPTPITTLKNHQELSGLWNFRHFSSESESIEDWLDESTAQIKQTNDSRLDRSAVAEHNLWIDDVILFPRLILLTRDLFPNQRIELEKKTGTWKTGDLVTVLSQYGTVTAHLSRFYADFLMRDELERIIELDITMICGRLFMFVKGLAQYEELINTQGDKAKSLIELFQMLLDLPSLDPVFRRPFISALLGLSSKSGLYPATLMQKDVAFQGQQPGRPSNLQKGTLQGKDVAIKIFNVHVTLDFSQTIKEALQETLVWRQLRHVNVLEFLGLRDPMENPGQFTLISPWLNNGNVQEFLRRVKDADRMSLVLDIAEGLDYLHSMQPVIVHGRLKGANILITDTHRACLSDFGASIESETWELEPSVFQSARTQGMVRWTAPELLSDEKSSVRTEANDVYAFACVCYEVFSGNIAFNDIQLDKNVIVEVVNGKRPTRPVFSEPWHLDCTTLGLDDDTWSVVEDSWQMEAAKRPTPKDIIQRLSLKISPESASSRRMPCGAGTMDWLSVLNLNLVR